MTRTFDPETLRTLADDMERLLRGEAPAAELLLRAPCLDRWTVANAASPVLVGTVAGHPSLGPGPIVTSMVWRIDETASWARTTSRFYRLGRRAV